MLYAIIMAGGSGTRFWPLSRKSRPKQFLSLDHGGKSLLRLTFERIKDTVPPQRIYVVTASAQRDMTAKELPELNLENILAEPVPRNTAAAIGYAVIRITRDDPQSGFVVLPSDHLIEDKEQFISSLSAGAQFASKTDSIVTLGISPTSPSTSTRKLAESRSSRLTSSRKSRTPPRRRSTSTPGSTCGIRACSFSKTRASFRR